MKAWRIVVIVTMGLILASLGGVALMDVWIRTHTLYPTPQNESAFLKTYSPQPVVDRFKCTNCNAQTGSGMSASAGKQFVRRTANYDGTFGLRPGQQFDLMDALRTDLLERINAAGARAVRQTGNAHEGFRADYASSNSVGSISILPMQASPVEGNRGWPPGFEQVTLHLVIDERWYPSGAGALEAVAHSEP